MADVYSKAAKVLFWLGPGSDNSPLALSCLDKIASNVQVDWAKTDEIHWADRNVDPMLNEAELLAINDLIHRPWFDRLWVRQEIYLASGDIDVICGNHKTLWENIRISFKVLYTKPRPWFSQQQDFLTRTNAVYNLYIGQKNQHLIRLIDQLKNCACSDPRDRIFALLSLLHPTQSVTIELDYTKNHGGSSLEVEGVIIAVIQNVEKISLTVTSAVGDDARELKRIGAWAGIQARSCLSSELKAFARAVCSNDFAERYSPSAIHIPAAAQVERALYGVLMADVDSELAPPGDLDDYQILLNRATRFSCLGRSFYMTEDGSPSLAPLAAKPGDYVTVLLGCETTMILRPTKDGIYKVVGKAYCDGFMDREALFGPLPDSFKAILRYNSNVGSHQWAYLNEKTGAFQAEDPRLGPLPDGWSIRSHKNEEFSQLFMNSETRKKTGKDPRLASEALRKRGVVLQVFDLV